MSDDKRFDATPSRRERAKREGNVAHSAELTGMAAFAGATAAAIVAVPLGAAAVGAILRDVAAHPSHMPAPSGWSEVAAAALAPAAVAAVAGSGVAVLQRGVHVNAPAVDVRRLSPAAGLKRMVGGEALVGIARGTCGFAAALIALIPVDGELVSTAAGVHAPGAAALLVGRVALRAFGAALAVGVAFAFVDYGLVRRRWLRSLKMSLHEMKRDAKENEGDPHARARRKGAHRAIVRGAIARVREASFVVVNPSHVAVALRYAPPEVPVPLILVRALDAAALRVRAIAREHAVPIVEDVALARQLFAHGENGRAIPPDCYVAVAQTIAALARAGLC